MEKYLSALRNNNVICIGTDTLYGLACLEAGIEEIYRLKGRDHKKPLIRMIYHIDQIALLNIELSSFQYQQCDKL